MHKRADLRHQQARRVFFLYICKVSHLAALLAVMGGLVALLGPMACLAAVATIFGTAWRHVGSTLVLVSAAALRFLLTSILLG
jgi:hypothetical protein